MARLRGGVKRATVKTAEEEEEEDDTDEDEDDASAGPISTLKGVFTNVRGSYSRVQSTAISSR